MKQSLHALLLATLAGLTFNANALCVNPDGSLDDASVPDGSVAKEMLPACEIRSGKAAESSSIKPKVPASAQSAINASANDKRANTAN